MKRIFIPALLIGLTFASCKNKTEMDNFDHEAIPGSTNDSTDATYSDTSVDETAKPGVSNYDELLDSYENYIDSYISAMKKSKSISDMKEYLAFMGKAQDLSSELEKSQDDMTSEQKKRFVDLQDKFAQSLMEIK